MDASKQIDDDSFNLFNDKLLKAAKIGNLNDVIDSLQRGAQVDTTDLDGRTPLMWACANEYAEVVLCLLQHHAKTEIKDINGSTAIMFSAESNKNTVIIAYLIQYNADIHAKNNDGETALMFACMEVHMETAALLIEKGAVIDAADNDGETALMLACMEGHTHTATFLIEKGAAIHVVDKNGYTILMLACANGHTDTAAFLIEKGAAIHIADKNGCTALMLACMEAHMDTAALLIEKGAVIDAADNDGYTAFELVFDQKKEDNKEDIARLLLSYMVPAKRQALANRYRYSDFIHIFEKELKEKFLGVYGRMRFERWEIKSDSIFNLLPSELIFYIRAFEVLLKFKEKMWYRFGAFERMSIVQDKPIFPVLFLNNKEKNVVKKETSISSILFLSNSKKRKAESKPEENNRLHEKRLA